jgi:anti-anti-sigma factor
MMCAEPALEIVAPFGGGCTVELRGELDVDNADRLAAEIRDVAHGKVVLLDLAGLSFIDASGVRALATVRNVLAQDGRWLFIERPRPQVRRIIDLVERLQDEQLRSFGIVG